MNNIMSTSRIVSFNSNCHKKEISNKKIVKMATKLATKMEGQRQIRTGLQLYIKSVKCVLTIYIYRL